MNSSLIEKLVNELFPKFIKEITDVSDEFRSGNYHKDVVHRKINCIRQMYHKWKEIKEDIEKKYGPESDESGDEDEEQVDTEKELSKVSELHIDKVKALISRCERKMKHIPGRKGFTIKYSPVYSV